MCGIAGYTRHLVPQLEATFDVEVFDLDQYFMRATHPRVRKVADRMIKDLCARLGAFDSVNIQLEHGALGSDKSDILRRFKWIANAAPSLSVTFHTVMPPQQPFPVMKVTGDLARLSLRAALQSTASALRDRVLGAQIYKVLRRLQRVKPVSAIVHTRRDARMLKHVVGLTDVFDHPLAFLSEPAAAQIRASATRAAFPLIRELPAEVRLIGVFGFLSAYKGFDTVVRALHRLPENYHLAIFGAVHPNEIKQRSPIDPYVRTLLDEARADRRFIDELGSTNPSFVVTEESRALLLSRPNDIGHRIHFLGAQTDADFARAMAVCDAVVLPYLEVGQSSSGPMSIAVDMKARIIAARSQAFIQFARYHPGAVEFFEIGNHLELADRIMGRPPTDARQQRFDALSNARIYAAANGLGPDLALTT